jgi:F-type H+-transporting ATPase subunit delta
MKINKEIRRLSREMLRASFTDGQLDPGRIASLVDSLIAKKPRNYIDVLKNYRRLLRLEVEKRRARIETASEVDREATSKVIENLKKRYGDDLTTEFVVNPRLLGGMRIRVGSDVWDGTVRNRLERLQQQL